MFSYCIAPIFGFILCCRNLLVVLVFDFADLRVVVVVDRHDKLFLAYSFDSFVYFIILRFVLDITRIFLIFVQANVP